LCQTAWRKANLRINQDNLHINQANLYIKVIKPAAMFFTPRDRDVTSGGIPAVNLPLICIEYRSLTISADTSD